MKLTITIIAAMCMMALGVGCDTTPRNQGAGKSYRIESRLPDEGNRLGSADLVVATEQMAAAIAGVPQIRGDEGRTIIVMDRIENKTSMPTADFEIFLARVRVLLNKSGMKRNIAFVENRNIAEGVKIREGIGETSRTRPRYVLKGIFYDLPRGSSNYHLLTYQLMDIENDILVWEDQYEVKL